MKETKLVNQRGFRMWKSGKQWLTSGAVAGVAVVSMAGGTVMADEIANPVPTEVTGVATAPITETTGVPVTESTITNDTATGNAATNLADAAAGNNAGGAAADASAGTVTGETPVTIDHTEVTDAAKDAEAVGVNVIQDPTSVAPTASNASQAGESKESIVADEHTKAEELKSTANSFSTANSEWTEEKNSIVDFNTDLDKAHLNAVDAYNNFVSTLNSDTAAVVAQYKDAIIKVTEQVQKSSDGTTVEGYQAYIKELADQQAINKANIEGYLPKKAEYDSLSTQASQTVVKNASLSASVVAKNNSLSASASAENTRLSNSASTVVANNTALSNSVKAKNDSLSASASAENVRLSNSASTVVANNTALSNSVKAKNDSLSASAAAENARLSNSAKAENERLSLSASAVNDSNATNSASVQKVNDEANAYNKSVMEEAGLKWTGNWDTDSATVSAYNAKGAADSSIFSDGHDRSKGLPAAANGYTPSGSSTMLASTKLANGVEVIAKGNLTQNGSTVYLRGDNVDESKVVTVVNWTSQNLEGDNLKTFNPGSGATVWGNLYDYRSGNASKFYIVKQLTWYKIAGAATTMDGNKHDVYVQFHKDSTGLAPEYRNDEVAVWNANGAINAIDGGATQPGAADGIRTIFSLDKPGNDDPNILWVELIADIDGGQYIEDGNDLVLLGVGGGMATNSVITKRVASDENLGYTYGKNKNNNALDGYRSSPDGTVLAMASGQFTYVLRNTKGGNGSAVARADFGGDATAIISVVRNIALKPLTEFTSSNTSYTPVTYNEVSYTPDTLTPVAPPVYNPVTYTPEEFTPENPDYTPVTYTPDVYTPEKVVDVPEVPVLELVEITAPADPEFKDIPEAPKTPTVRYHLTSLNSNTPVNKTVQNEEGVNINNQSVAKGSVNTFTLNPQPLVAGRPITTSIVYSDYIEDGLEIDIAKSQSDNKNWDISFNEKTRLLQVRGTSTELALTNADRSKDYDPTSFVITYKVLNDAATYTNTFRMDVNGGATGNVNVEYYVEGTNIKLGEAKDTEEAPVGESYDTTDLRPEVFAKDGKLYERVVSHVEGEETGEVSETDKVVKYFYQEVPNTPGTGDVIRHFVDEDGNTIHKDTVDTKDGKVGDPYDTSDGIEDIKGYELVPSKTIGNEKGEITEGVTEVTYVYKRLTPKPTKGNGYTSYSNKVTIHTPGGKNNPNDPQNPNGPGNEKIQPVKNNTNESGDNINGKTLLQNDVNYYVAEWDLDQYINDKSSKSAIAKGFAYIDNPDDKALVGIEKDFKAIDAKGGEVEGLRFYKADSAKLEELPASVRQLIDGSGIDVSEFGTFYVWVAEDSQAFYDKYVQTGTDIFFNLPMSVKEGFTGDYTNQTWQIDFGNGYVGNVVENNTPDLVPEKDVIVDGNSANGGTIAYGQEFKYLLKGAVIPGNRGDVIWEYKYIDDYDQAGDKFLGSYGVKATTDITVRRIVTLEGDAVYTQDVTLEDGTVIKAGETIPKGTKLTITELIAKGSDLTKFTTMEHDEENGIVTIAFTEDFLKFIVSESEFGADATLDFKRIAYGTFENTYINRVNGVDYISNTVRTTTPAPITPEVPAKGGNTPVANTVVSPAQVLPQTGESTSNAGLLGGLLAIIAGIGMFFSGKRKEEN